MSYSTEDDIDKCTEKLSLILVKAAEESIPKVEGNRRKTAVPWWNDECSNSFKNRNKAFKMLKRTLTPEAVIEYQREKARRTIKHAKKKYWKDYCDSIGKETELGEVWYMLKKMIGIYKTSIKPEIWQ